jgi:hypothetical protein
MNEKADWVLLDDMQARTEAKSQEERLFLFWNLIWWSIPYERVYGRQSRFLVWDKTHDAPSGREEDQAGNHISPVRGGWDLRTANGA